MDSETLRLQSPLTEVKEMFNGTLSESDLLNPDRVGTFSDSFFLAGVSPGDVIQINLDSTVFDTYLQLVDVDTNAVIDFDDDDGPGFNAQLVFTVQANTNYVIRATSFDSGATGSYSINFNDGHLIPVPIPFIDNRETLQGSLTTDDFTNPDRPGSFRDDFFFEDPVVGERIQVDLVGNFDPYLQLINANTGDVIAFDDDSGTGLNARLTFTPQANTEYIFRATSFDDNVTGNYSITTTVIPNRAPNALIDANPFTGGALPEFASFDGRGNNQSFSNVGAAGTQLVNIAPLGYVDGGATLAGGDRPNARDVSNALGQQDELMPSSRGLTNFIWAFGQFLDHDLSLTPSQSREDAARNGEFINIDIPIGDPFLDPQGTGTVEIEVRRSEFVPGTGTDPNNPRQYENEITHWIDLSSVYGSDNSRANALRSFARGQLRVSQGNLLPLFDPSIDGNDNPGPTPNTDLFVAGDVRANENVVLASMHTLFVREHNRLATELAEVHPSWTDEQLFQRARQINIAQWQNVVYNEYLPTLLGTGVIPDYTGYNDAINPNISRTFSTAAYRLGHTQLSSEIQRLDANGNGIAQGPLSLFEAFFPSSSVVRETGIDPILRGMASTLSQEVDPQIIDDVRNMLFNFGNFSAAQDLFALNIQRGRDHGLADYNTIRAAFGLPRVTSFAEITSDVEAQTALEELYGDVDNIDAFAGMIAEDHIPGGSVGETIAAVLVDQFSSLRAGDRFYYENIFSPAEIALIEQTQLSDIIRRNTDTPIIQDNVFTLFNDGTAADDVLNGGLGDDRINGLGGNDQIVAHAGEDALSGQAGDDSIDAGSGNDRVLGGSGNDNLSGGAGNDSVLGGSGNDAILGGDGDDQLSGGVGNDDIDGNGGNDLILGHSGIDNLFGGAGTDRINGGSGNDFLQGDEGNDDLTGGSGSDVLVGVNDTASFPGRGERDTLTGGVGGDRFVLGRSGTVYYNDGLFNPGTGDSYALIRDFNQLQDTIQLAGFASQYRLAQVTLTGSSGLHTGIYRANTNDLVGVLENTQVTSFGSGFAFV
ncbi:MAG: peroxidase family protein [Synechococcales bacterium]|nr:peroxidase family protein [Synechococcales bacterium]